MLDRTRAIFAHGLAAGLHPGAQWYVSRDGVTLADEALGEARPGVPMTRDSLSLWMSAGKPVTAVAALMLVDRGLITLDTPIVDVMRDFGANGKAAITLRHILNHTAGFRGPLNNFTPGTWDEILARVCALKQEPGWVPGEKAGYHIGSSWFVLGELVRRLDGRTIDNFVREEVFAPLGEPAASIGIASEAFDRLEHDIALMWNVDRSPPTADASLNSRESNALPRPGANARGPIRALAKMYESLLEAMNLKSQISNLKPETKASAHPDPLPWYRERGAGLISAELVRAMASRQRVGMLDHTFKQTLDWGLGVMIDSKQYAGEHAYGFGPHASPDTFGHSGNQSSCAFADPRHGLVVAWTCNGMPGEAKHQARASAINRAIYEDLGLAREDQ